MAKVAPLLVLAATVSCAVAGSFGVDGDNFVKDGKPYRIISGAFHYWRTPHELWEDRMNKMVMGGLNTLETYVAWNLHEPVRGKYDFSGDLDVVSFVKLAASHGLLVIVRPPPYICGEWEFGGLPAWLLEDPDMTLRSSNERFMDAMDPFLRELSGRLSPLQYSRGGPIIAVQVENEYGSYGNDYDYLNHIRETLRSSGFDNVLFFSSNGGSDQMLVNGATPDILHTVNFGTGDNVGTNFDALRRAMPVGPLFCSEFWGGWFDHVGEGHHTVSASNAAKTMDQILSRNGSVSVYMYVGGTNFALMNGANTVDDVTSNGADKLQPTTTSYDYDAAISEDGDVSEKWSKFRDVIAKYASVPSDPAPKKAPKTAYGSVAMSAVSSLLDDDVLDAFGGAIKSAGTLKFSQMKLDYGYAMYETRLRVQVSGGKIIIRGLHDRATVWVDEMQQGTADRIDGSSSVRITSKRADAVLRILVENEGRANYGPGLADDKGILNGVVLDPNMYLFNWTIWPIPMKAAPPASVTSGKLLASLDGPNAASNLKGAPVFYKGSFGINEEPTDTFLKFDNWGKGIAYVNGHNLGRYWHDKGPQQTLYVPAPFLKKGQNEVIMFEEYSLPSSMNVDFVDYPDLG